MARRIVITSGKGGVGKTTVTAFIAIGLAATGKKVVTVDADIGLRNLDTVLGMENRIVYDILDVMEGTTKLNKALIKHKKHQNLCMLPASQTHDKESFGTDQIKALCLDLSREFDYVLIDCPAGIDKGFKNAIAGASEAIVVTTPEVNPIRDADRVIGLLESEGIKELHLIVNNFRADMVKARNMLDIDDIKEQLGIPLYGVIPFDQAIIVATNMGDPIYQVENSKAATAFKNIIRRMEGEDIPLTKFVKMESFFEKLMRFFSRRKS